MNECRWAKAGPNADVGKLRIRREPGKKAEVYLRKLKELARRQHDSIWYLSYPILFYIL